MLFQINTQVLDFCVLAIVNREDVYGYSLTQRMLEAVDLSESTLYPVLRRLKSNHFLETYDREFEGRNRRYYRITDRGKKQLELYERDWETYVQSVEKLTNREEEA